MTGDKAKKGFTMIEALVVLAAFGLIMILIADIYAQTTRFGRSIVMRAKVQADARIALEAMVRATRVSSFDYEAWGGELPLQPTSELKLVNPANGFKSIIRLETSDAGCFSDGKSYPCIVVSTDDGATWTPLTSRGAKIDSLQFHAGPKNDPFLFDSDSGTYGSDQHPFLTIVMVMHGLGKRASDDWIYTLQTTVTPRLYLR